MARLPGAENGFIEVEYLGSDIQRSFWTSPNRFTYQFSAKKNRFLADAGDAEHFTSKKLGDGSPMFRIVEQRTAEKADAGARSVETDTEPVQEPVPAGAGAKPPHLSEREWRATRSAQREMKLYGIALDEIEGTGKDGRIRVNDVNAHLDTWEDDVEGRATEAAIAAAEENGIDIRMLFKRVPDDRRIGKKDVDNFVAEFRATMAEFDGSDDD